MSEDSSVVESYEEWKAKYDDLCHKLTSQPNIASLLSRHPIQRQIGLKLLTVQLAQLAYTSSSHIVLSDRLRAVAEDSANPPHLKIIDENDRCTVTAPMITANHQKIFAYLQIRCNELFKEQGKPILPLLRLTPMMLIDLTAEPTAIDHADLTTSASSLCATSEITESIVAKEIDDPIENGSTRMRKKKKNKKKSIKNHKKQELVDENLTGEREELIVYTSEASEVDMCLERSQYVEEAQDVVVTHTDIDESTRSKTQEVIDDINGNKDELLTVLSSNCRSLSSQTLNQLFQCMQVSSHVTSLVQLLVTSYEDMIFKRVEAYEEKLQMLYMRLFIAETTFENEKEDLLKQIESLKMTLGSTTPLVI